MMQKENMSVQTSRRNPVAGIFAFLGMVSVAGAQYVGWQNSGSIYLLTTPEGANLLASATEKDFPLLVRLDKDWFDFSQAKAGGADIRFATAAGAQKMSWIIKKDEMAELGYWGMELAPTTP